MLTPPSGAAADKVTHVLDGNGNRLETLIGAGVAIVRSFDERGRIRSRRDVAANETVGYTWWPGGALKTLAYPGLETPVAYVYDGLGRLSTVTDWLGGVTSYTWWATGQLQSAALPGGITARWTIDDAGRLSRS